MKKGTVQSCAVIQLLVFQVCNSEYQPIETDSCGKALPLLPMCVSCQLKTACMEVLTTSE